MSQIRTRIHFANPKRGLPTTQDLELLFRIKFRAIITVVSRLGAGGSDDCCIVRRAKCQREDFFAWLLFGRTDGGIATYVVLRRCN